MQMLVWVGWGAGGWGRQAGRQASQHAHGIVLSVKLPPSLPPARLPVPQPAANWPSGLPMCCRRLLVLHSAPMAKPGRCVLCGMCTVWNQKVRCRCTCPGVLELKPYIPRSSPCFLAGTGTKDGCMPLMQCVHERPASLWPPPKRRTVAALLTWQSVCNWRSGPALPLSLASACDPLRDKCAHLSKRTCQS